jgi:flagellar hook-associated protein 2
VLNTSGGVGVRLLINGSQSGLRGRVAVDGDVGIAFSETAAAQDALLAFGATASNGGVLVASSTNQFKGIVEDVEFNIGEPSDTPVTVTVSANTDNVSKQLQTFVDQFNKLRTKLDEVTVFDEATQSVGLLFGKNSALRVDLAFGRFLSGTLRGAGPIKSLAQLGIRLNETGKLEFDKTKFNDALSADPAAVEEFFTKEDFGFSAKAKALADSLAGVESGALLNRSSALQNQIEQNSKRIDSMDVRLDRQRERLLKQFYNMETAIAKLQQNLSALNQLQIIPPLGSN